MTVVGVLLFVEYSIFFSFLAEKETRFNVGSNQNGFWVLISIQC